MSKVVIVGGGLAGLTAAYYLSKFTEHSIELYEAEKTLGGRVQTTEVDGFKFNYGAFMVFSWYKAFIRLLRDLGVEQSKSFEPLDGDHEYAWDEATQKFHEINQRWVFDDLPVQTLIKTLPTFLTHKSELYLPDTSRFQSMTVSDYFSKIDSKETDLDIINKIAVGYTYGTISQLPLSVYFGFAKEILLNRGFKKVRALKDGADKIVELLEKELVAKGVSINTSSRVMINENKKVLLDGKHIEYDFLLIANGSEKLLNPLIPDINNPVQYNDHYVACLRTENTTTVCGNNEWNILYTSSINEDKPQLTSIGNFEATFPEHPAKTLITYLRVPPSLKHSFTQDDAKNEILHLTKKFLPDAGEITIKFLHHWENTMPIVTLETLNIIKTLQGKNNIYFAGDYLGAPSMEVAVRSGLDIAQKITKQK